MIRVFLAPGAGGVCRSERELDRIGACCWFPARL